MSYLQKEISWFLSSRSKASNGHFFVSDAVCVTQSPLLIEYAPKKQKQACFDFSTDMAILWLFGKSNFCKQVEIKNHFKKELVLLRISFFEYLGSLSLSQSLNEVFFGCLKTKSSLLWSQWHKKCTNWCSIAKKSWVF